MSVLNPDLLDGNVVGIAAMFYMLADLDQSIPKPTITLGEKYAYLFSEDEEIPEEYIESHQ